VLVSFIDDASYEKMIKTIFYDLYLLGFDPKTIIIMIAIGGVIRKYRYVAVSSAAVALLLTLWVYVFHDIPSEWRLFLAQVYVFAVGFIAAMFWGSLTWLLVRHLFDRRSSKRPGESGLRDIFR